MSYAPEVTNPIRPTLHTGRVVPAVLVVVAVLVAVAALFLPRPVRHVPPVPGVESPLPSVAPSRTSSGTQVGHATPDAGVAIRAEIGFRTHDELVEHYRKHGSEFGSVTMDAYLLLAQTLRDRPAGGALLEAVRADRVITRYDRASGAFLAFNRDGTIRTFFRPNAGEAYYRRQLARRGGVVR